MNYKYWIMTMALFTFVLCSPFLFIASYNYYVDPFWNFSHKNKLNESQIAFNERQLKVNYLAQQKLQYETLLVGTSRTTYINQNDFLDMNVFNFSAGSLALIEYNPYIQYATEQNKEKFETIILEVYPFQNALKSDYPEPKTFIEINEEPFYGLTSLFSFDTYTKSQRNASDEVPDGFRIYNRHNVVSLDPVSKDVVRANIDRGLRTINTIINVRDMPGYTEELQRIKNQNPNSEFILYSPPFFHERLVKFFKEEAGIQTYRNWLEACIEVFGGVVNFTTINKFSLNEKNYFDSQHFYPEAGKFIVQDIYALKNGQELQYGTFVTADNLDNFMHEFEQQLLKQTQLDKPIAQ